MKSVLWAVALICASLALAVPAGSAHAQATRTWVSGVGDDANPCSRTAPCKTFAGAISKTAAGGIIDCLDPGGYGAVSITKSIVISCVGANSSGALASGVTAFTVNAGPNDVVTIQNVSAEGNPGTGLVGIRFVAGGALHVRNVVIQQFQAASPNGVGILFAPTNATSQLFVSDTTIKDNTGGGILIQPSGTGTIRVALQNVQMFNNQFGLKADVRTSTASVTGGIADSFVAGGGSGGGPGVSAVTQAGGGSVDISIDRTTVTNNAEGVMAKGGASAILRVTNATLTANTSAFSQNAGGLVYSYGTNQIDGNPMGTFTSGTLH